MKSKSLLSFVLLLILLTLQSRMISAQDFPRVCLEDPANIMPNCKFDNGLDGWHTFTEDGTANISVLQGGGECHAPLCPAAYIVTESYFVGGIYQQVPVAAGNTYYANINWLVFDSYANDATVNSAVGGIGRRMGIDPSGGTDSRSPNVIWGPDNWRSDCKTCEAEYVTATAQADTITVFVRIEDTWRQRAAEKGFGVPPSKDQFWLDEVGLKQVAGDAVAVQPTDTPVSEAAPTETPIAASPLETPISATDTPATATPTATPEIIETEEATPESSVETPTAPATIAPPPTLTPTNTPPPTPTFTPRSSAAPTRLRRATATPTGNSVLPMLGIAGTTICAGGVILLVIIIIVAGLVWLYRLGWGNVNDESDEYFDDDDNDDDGIVVEIIDE